MAAHRHGGPEKEEEEMPNTIYTAIFRRVTLPSLVPNFSHNCCTGAHNAFKFRFSCVFCFSMRPAAEPGIRPASTEPQGWRHPANYVRDVRLAPCTRSSLRYRYSRMTVTDNQADRVRGFAGWKPSVFCATRSHAVCPHLLNCGAQMSRQSRFKTIRSALPLGPYSGLKPLGRQARSRR